MPCPRAARINGESRTSIIAVRTCLNNTGKLPKDKTKAGKKDVQPNPRPGSRGSDVRIQERPFRLLGTIPFEPPEPGHTDPTIIQGSPVGSKFPANRHGPATLRTILHSRYPRRALTTRQGTSRSLLKTRYCALGPEEEGLRDCHRRANIRSHHAPRIPTSGHSVQVRVDQSHTACGTEKPYSVKSAD